MNYKYIRISSKNQNPSRQTDNNLTMFTDICSGTIPFSERQSASKLLELLRPNDLIVVESIDRLGRDKIDMMKNIQFLKNLGVVIKVENLGISSHFENGTENPVFDLISSLLSVLSSYERELILERTQQGIEIAKLKKLYKGRKTGSVIPYKKFKEQNHKCFLLIEKHPSLSLRELAKLCGISHSKVKKIKTMI